MAIAFPRAALKSLIADLTGFPEGNVVWAVEPLPFIAPKGGVIQGQIVLNVVTRVALGNDEERKTFTPEVEAVEGNPEENIEPVVGVPAYETSLIGGQRMNTVSVRVESFNSEIYAEDVLEELRIGLCRRSSLDALHAVDLGFSDVSAINTIPNISVDQRAISVATLDLFLSQAVYPDAPTVSDDTWIDDVSPTTDPDDELFFTDVDAEEEP